MLGTLLVASLVLTPFPASADGLSSKGNDVKWNSFLADIRDDEQIDDYILFAETETTQIYLSEDELLRVDITDVGTPSIKKLLNGHFEQTTVKDISVSQEPLSFADKKSIQEEGLKSGSLTRTDQNQNSMGNYRITLKVTYSNGTAGLHLCKATGSYTRLLYEGVTAQPKFGVY